MASPSPSSARIPRESFANAVDALLKWFRTQPKHQKSQLFEPDDVVYLVLTLARIPSKGRTNPYRIPIPHPLHPFDPQSTSICLILDDRPSSPLLPSAALDHIRARDLPIASVIGLSELRSDYRPYESRRKLCDSYDLFFADRKILPLLPRLLGKHFFKRKKIPLAVDSARLGWAEQIKSWCESTLLYLRTGTCAGLKIGRVMQSRDEIVGNAVAAIEGAMDLVPRKWGNLRSVHVKTVESVALPVYQAVPEIGLKIEGVLEEEGGSLVKGKRGRGEEGKKRKMGRLHNAGAFDMDGGDGEVFGLEDGDDDKNVLIGNKEEEVNAEPEEKEMKKKKRGMKGLKVKKPKGERNADGEFSGKKAKKKKTEEVAVVAADGGMTVDDDGDEANADVVMRKKKAKKGGKGTDSEEKIGEENGATRLSVSESRTKKKKVDKEVAAASGEKKKSKTKKSKSKV